MSAQERFAGKVADLIRQARSLSPAVRKNVIDMLEEARKRIVGEISAVDPSSYQGAQMANLRREIDKALDTFRTQLTDYTEKAQTQAFQSGEAIVGQPLAAVGLPAPSVAGFSTHALAVAQGYTADLIGGLAKDSAAKLNAAIQRAFLGGRSIADVIERIGQAISKGDGFTGLFSDIGQRAERIAVNEILRVHSIAAQAKMEDAVKANPKMKKRWVHVPIARVPRISHIEADGQTVDVNDPFDVDGEDLMYPRDPNGSPENTINCHCLMQPYFDESALAPSARHKQILQDLGISIQAA
jgi:uncharacterized protein with gpF-like domain